MSRDISFLKRGSGPSFRVWGFGRIWVWARVVGIRILGLKPSNVDFYVEA